MKDPNILKNYQKYQNKSIAIIGHMGSGKSIVGKLIAKNLKLKHLDSDQLIEKNTKKTINQIFCNESELGFRKIEEKIILNFSNMKNIVLSLGGGSILSQKIRKFLKKEYITLFLDVDIATLTKRLKKSTRRPLLLNVNIEEKIKELDSLRRQYYLLADITLKNYETPLETLSEFLKKYNKLNEKNN